MTTVLSPKGKLLQIETAAPVCEKLVRFNGKRRLLMELAERHETATAIALRVARKQNDPFIDIGQELLVGNLPSGKVDEILKALLTQGFYDFTELTYQKAKNSSELIFDQGKSLPYTTESTGPVSVGRFCADNNMSGLSLPLTAHDLDTGYGWCSNNINAPEDNGEDIWSDEDGVEEEDLNGDEN